MKNKILSIVSSVKFRKETKDTLRFVLILIIIYVILVLSFQYLPFLNKYHTYAIQTNSMEPVIDVGDIVIIKEIEIDEIQVGDIMAFNVDVTGDNKDDVVVHYIDEIIPFGDEYIYKTRPEISDQQDRWTIEQDDIIGRYQFQMHNVGRILLFLQSTIGKIVLLVDIIIVSVIYDILFKKDKNKITIEDNDDIGKNDDEIKNELD